MYLENQLQKKFNLSNRRYVNNGIIWIANDKILKTFEIISSSELNKFQKNFSYLKSLNNSSVVLIHDFGKEIIQNHNKIYFYYVMDKLQKISRDHESGKFFQNILNHYCFYNRKINIPKFLDSKLICFMENIRKIKYKYTDFHSGNIMWDSNQNYKLIDLESFII